MTSLEGDVLFLMELMSESYVGVMCIPYSRRKRIVEKKHQIETNRAANMKASKGRSVR